MHDLAEGGIAQIVRLERVLWLRPLLRCRPRAYPLRLCISAGWYSGEQKKNTEECVSFQSHESSIIQNRPAVTLVSALQESLPASYPLGGAGKIGLKDNLSSEPDGSCSMWHFRPEISSITLRADSQPFRLENHEQMARNVSATPERRSHANAP